MWRAFLRAIAHHRGLAVYAYSHRPLGCGFVPQPIRGHGWFKRARPDLAGYPVVPTVRKPRRLSENP